MISKDVVLRMAELSRLTLTEKEQENFVEQFSAILKYFEQMDSVDTSGIAPMVTPTEISLHLREDIAEDSKVSDSVLEKAPAKSGRLFKVPPVVG